MKEENNLGKKFFGEFKFSSELREQMNSSNMFIGVIVSPVMFVMSFALTLLSFLSVYRGINYRISNLWFIFQLVIYFLLMVSSIILFFTSYKFLKRKHVSKVRRRFSLYFFISVCYIFGAFTAIEDFLGGSHLYSFFAVALFVPLLFYLRPITFITFTAFSFYVVLKIIFEFIRWKGLPNVFTKIDIVNIVEIGFIVIVLCFIRFLEKNRNSMVELKIQSVNSDLHKLSYYDALTGLKNRYALRDDYDSFVGKDLFVMMLDVDDFKFFNDNFGHNIGDEILKQMSSSLRLAFTDEYCYRFGGDEILILYPNADEAEFKNTITAWRAVFHGIENNGKVLKCSCSCGYIFGRPESQADLRRMIQFADVQLYEAKRRGKNCEVGKSYISALYANSEENIYTKVEHKDNSLDALTGVNTMMHFRNKAWLLVHNNSDFETSFCYIYFDIVNFKSFNEIHGFAEGDELLVELAAMIKKVFDQGLVARFAQDQFVILTELDEVERKINEVSDSIYAKWNARVKAGIYSENLLEIDVTTACDRAKLSCNSIKKVHGVNYKFFDENLKNQVERKKYIIEHFQNALDSGYIKIYFQPVIDTENRRTAYVEALTRWQDEKYGELMPGEFIPVLENSHLISRLDLFVLEKVAALYHSLPSEKKKSFVPVSLNISSIDFILCNMHEEINSIMGKYFMPHELICFELKENEFQQNQDMLNAELSLLKEKGFNIWLDDFGRGYIPLNILDEGMFNVIKMDVNYLGKVYEKDKLKIIVTHLARIAIELNIKVLARGVETQDQFVLYHNLGCDYVQGYFVLKPYPIENFGKTEISSTLQLL